MRDDPHLERRGALHHFAADAAEADDAERLAAQLVAEELLLFPLAGLGGGVGLRDVRAPWRASARACARRPKWHCRRACSSPARRLRWRRRDRRCPRRRRRGRSRAASAPSPGLPCVTFTALRTSRASAVGKMLRVFLRIRDDDVPAGLGFQQFDSGGARGSATRIFML